MLSKTLKHLEENNQNYCQHFAASISFCGESLKASFYFFFHAIVPGCFTVSGSTVVFKLCDSILETKKNAKADTIDSQEN